ncbi:PREDICTED: scarecrow-like protein 9 [Ipomoea nil]|uniref:scarecrow-like protein 9 n=1 Tax=Ipomoea nil TaxID=35883 RepID=UPI000901C799|nr:PREDICTED: scarecrow-like protein 9 [Ipomoea nil]XP_019161678.1 PREDICTED: scarecrow-like protein 9 [Ipomoea nil]XP_019161679.1 PREDICTED: scarecrow-like protein 9 [Ipomoea nil]
MDPRLYGFSGSWNGVGVGSQSLPFFPDPPVSNRFNFEDVYQDRELIDGPRTDNSLGGGHNFEGSHDPLSRNVALTSNQDDYEDDDFSDADLRYINQILMEEEMEDKTYMLQESLELQAKERSFYEALGKKYPPTPERNPSLVHQISSSRGDYEAENHQIYITNSGPGPGSSSIINQSNGSLGEYESENHHNYYYITGSNEGSSYLIDPGSINVTGDYISPYLHGFSVPNGSNSSVSSSNSFNNRVDGFVESPVSSFCIPNIYSESQPIWNFKKGVEEGNKFLPTNDKLLASFDANQLVTEEPTRETSEKSLRVRKNPHREDLEDQRSSKQAAIFAESTIRSEEFDIVLLHSMGKGEEALAAYRQNLQSAIGKKIQQNGNSKGPGGGKGRGKKQNGKRDVIDLRTLLITCAQAVAADDRRGANELLKQIRQHSSPFGDGSQRLANCFADGLEARLAGTGSQIYKALVNKRTSASDYLKAYHLYLASCPFRKISCFASNKTTIIKSANSMRVHIIDFGILYGFQWPTLIQRIADRDGGPPKVRITGIEFPQPGFRPAERIEETGRRLADYAKSFNVPFEYNAIAKKWETITLEDLKLDKDEFLVVNCLYRFKNLHDETVLAEGSRTLVLNLIRKINPDIFIHGIVNGAYSAPFFVTRFREALFHFSALFDMLETNVPRDIPERMLIEREIFGREALNIMACEGWERVERPETYKQWQVRNLRAGFTQIPFANLIMNKARDKVRTGYHKDFVIDEDGQWLLLGWKGRTIYAISCWVPV